MRVSKAAVGGALAVLAATAIVVSFRNYYSDAGPVVRSVCLSNLRQIGQAIALYVESNDQRYPPMYVAQAQPKNPDTLTCPTIRRSGGVGGYVLNADLLDKPRGDTAATTIVFFERDAAAPGDVGPLSTRGTHRHGSRSNVVFEDGNAVSLPNP